MDINDVIYGFKVTNIKEFETPKLKVYEFEHLYSGAKTELESLAFKYIVFAPEYKCSNSYTLSFGVSNSLIFVTLNP